MNPMQNSSQNLMAAIFEFHDFLIKMYRRADFLEGGLGVGEKKAYKEVLNQFLQTFASVTAKGMAEEQSQPEPSQTAHQLGNGDYDFTNP